jgi:hypothetical protein
MINHNHNIENRTLWHYDENKKCIYVESNGYIDKGDEVFTSYGIKSNTDLYVMYGFTLENNERKFIELEFNNKEYECLEEYDHVKNKVQKLLDDIKNLIIHEKPDLKKEKVEISKFTKFIEICENRLNKYPTKLENDIKELKLGEWCLKNNGDDTVIITYGPIVDDVLDRFNNHTIVNAIFQKPIDIELLKTLLNKKHIVIYDVYGTEEGFASIVKEALYNLSYTGKISSLVVPSSFVKHGTISEQMKELGITLDDLAKLL